jgi:hypothetical protein
VLRFDAINPAELRLNPSLVIREKKSYWRAPTTAPGPQNKPARGIIAMLFGRRGGNVPAVVELRKEALPTLSR